jgi:glycerophosphoryl diester phosphodiesterase
MAHESVQVIASCGLHHDVPPNTLAAFEAAIEAGCDMIETDFRACAEGVIVCHDERVAGRPIDDMTRDEIRQAVCLLPPTLDEVIACCRGRIGLDLELKEVGLEETVLDALVPSFEPHQFVISSFLSSTLRRVRALSAVAPTGLLTIRGLTQYFEAHPEWADSRSSEAILDEVAATGATYLVPDSNDLELFEAADRAAVETIAWGADTEPHLRAVLSATHLRGVITEEPALLRRLLNEGRA